MRLSDVTLRECDQMPGRSYTREEKIQAGIALDELGVAFIQAGFPATGEKDRAVLRELSEQVNATTIALSRAVPSDVDAALDANADVVEIFAPLSDLHLEYDIGKSRDEMLELLEDALVRARDGGATVHLGLLDAFRTDPDHLVAVFERFPDVQYVGLPDTVGVSTPTSVRSVLTNLGGRIDLGRVGVHFHQDLGAGVANTLEANRLGVGKADVSVGALGERAGNAPLEEIIVAGDIESDETFGVDPTVLVPTCERALETLGEEIHPQKPILGREVTRHESGLHTAAMLDEPSTFEPFNPARYGGERKLVFGIGTGRTSARKLLERAGESVTDDRIKQFQARLADVGPIDKEKAIELAAALDS